MIPGAKLAALVFLILSCLDLHAQDSTAVSEDHREERSCESFDQRLFRKINGYRTPFLDNIIPLTEKPATVTAIALPIIMYTSSRIDGNYYDQNSAALLGVSEAANIIVTLGIKFTIQRKRPVESLGGIYYKKDFKLKGDRYSHPSGHTSTAFNIATLLTLRYPDNPILITGLYLHAAVISYGRMYIGVHYPGDILMGMLVGAGTAIATFSLRKEIINAKADLFNEEERKETGSSKINQYVALGTVIGMDLFNYFILGQTSEIIKGPGLQYSNVGGAPGLKFTYGF